MVTYANSHLYTGVHPLWLVIRGLCSDLACMTVIHRSNLIIVLINSRIDIYVSSSRSLYYPCSIPSFRTDERQFLIVRYFYLLPPVCPDWGSLILFSPCFCHIVCAATSQWLGLSTENSSAAFFHHLQKQTPWNDQAWKCVTPTPFHDVSPPLFLKLWHDSSDYSLRWLRGCFRSGDLHHKYFIGCMTSLRWQAWSSFSWIPMDTQLS